jgi:hypothetical protein
MRGAVLTLFVIGLAAAAAAQQPTETLPKLISHGDAIYPQIAKTAHIMGDVVVRITTNGESVVDAKAESGPPVLTKASEDNAKTWKFAPHPPGTFRITYRYKLTDGDVATFPTSSAIVEISAGTPMIRIDYGWIYLGKWKAELKSQHGSLSETFRFSFSGPKGEWLDVETGTTPSEDQDGQDNDDDEFSRRDGDFLIFSMKLLEPGGKRLETYFVGRMSGDKIAGTFIDEAGVRGTWTATRLPESEKK